MWSTPPPAIPTELAKTTPDNEPQAEFTWAAVPDVAEYRLTIDGVPVTLGPVTAYSPAAPIAEGRHVLLLVAFDAARNQSPPATLDFVIDLAPPSAPGPVTKEAPDSDPSPSLAWGPSVDVLSQIEQYQVRLDGGEWTEGISDSAWRPTAPIEDGLHTFEVRAVDTAGNVGEAGSLEFLVDTTPPPAPGGFVVDPGDLTEPPLFTWDATRDALSGLAGYELRLEQAGGIDPGGGPDWISVGLSLSFRLAALLEDSVYAAQVRAVDTVGNAGPPASLEFTIDTSPPQITAIGLVSSEDDTVVVSWTTDDPSTSFVEFGVTNTYGESTPPAGPAAAHSVELVDLSPGQTYHFRVRATDAVGNESLSEDRTFVVTADSRVEVRDLDVPTTTAAPGDDVTVTATVSNIGNVTANYSFPLVVNGDSVDTAQGVLDVGQSIEVSFILARDEDGTYDVEFGGLAGSFEIVRPVIVAAAVVSPEVTPETSVATSAQGEQLAVVEGRVEVKRDVGEIRVILPVVADEGTQVNAFLDSTSGLSLANDQLVIPIKDEEGKVAARIVADVETAEGTGETTEIKLGQVKLEVPEQTVDFSAIEEDIGEVSVSLEAQLNDLPTEVRIEVTIARDLPSSAVEAEIGARAGEEAKEIVGIAFSIIVEKEGLDDGTVVGATQLTTRVGRAWAERHGVENVRIFRLSDAGELTALETRFVGFDGDSAVFEADSPDGLSIFSLVALKPLPPSFEVRNLSMSKQSVRSGENVAVVAYVFNTGAWRDCM